MHAPRAEPLSLLGKLRREPLVRFLLIGLLLFFIYAVSGNRRGDHDIRVDDNVVAGLAAQFQRTRQRPPTASEMNALVDSYIRDEIFYREGVALGLDRDDPTIKRRVSQKFATIAEESGPASPPSGAELDRWLKENAPRYAEPSLVTFDQIMFESGAADIQAARKALVAGTDPQMLGTGRMLLPHFELYPLDLVEREFGPGFAKALTGVRVGRWEGPIASGFGVHLVRVEKILPGRAPDLDEVRKAVARDYEDNRRRQSSAAAYRNLQKEYRVDYSGAWRPATE